MVVRLHPQEQSVLKFRVTHERDREKKQLLAFIYRLHCLGFVYNQMAKIFHQNNGTIIIIPKPKVNGNGSHRLIVMGKWKFILLVLFFFITTITATKSESRARWVRGYIIIFQSLLSSTIHITPSLFFFFCHCKARTL